MFSAWQVNPHIRDMDGGHSNNVMSIAVGQSQPRFSHLFRGEGGCCCSYESWRAGLEVFSLLLPQPSVFS